MIRFKTLKAKGFAAFYGEVKVRLADRGLTLILGENQDSRSADSNGAGKTTIFKAISWALFGTTIDGLASSNIVHREATKAIVEVRFSVEHTEYSVTRTRTKSSTNLTLEEFDGMEWQDVSARKVRETQDAIVGLLGLDWDAFRCVCLFGQGDASRFASPTMGDAARKAVLHLVLGLERYTQARERARSGRSEWDKDLAALSEEFRDHERAHDIASAKIEQLEEDLEGEREVLDEGDDEKASALDELVECKARVAEAEEQLEEAKKNLASAEAEEARLSERYDVEDDEWEAAKTKWVRAREILKDLEVSECPTCGTEFDVDKDLVEKARRALDKAAKKERKAEAKATEARDASILAENEVDAQKATVRKAVGNLARAQGDAQTAEKVARMTIKSVENVEETIARIEKAISFKTTERAGHEAEMNRVREAQAHAQISRDAFDWWVTAFGPKGVQALVIERALPALNAHTNQHLIPLADGDITVRWSATRTGTSGTEIEELTCNVEIEGFEDVPPSGGQWRKIELATELALAEVVRESGGARTNLLLLDEALDGLDGEGSARVCRWLAELDFESVFIISHEETIADSFENHLTVARRDGRSTVRKS